MKDAEHVVVVETPVLTWPDDLRIPSQYFRLLVAADTTKLATAQIAQFAQAALANGMVYCCSWGPGCERFHDIVDETVVVEELSDEFVARPTADDTVMTTWHDDESLEEVVEFFFLSAFPTTGYAVHSVSWVAVSVSNSDWAKTVRESLKQLGAPVDLF